MSATSRSKVIASVEARGDETKKRKRSNGFETRRAGKAGAGGELKARLPKPKKRMRVGEYHSSSEDSAEEEFGDEFDLAVEGSSSASTSSFASLDDDDEELGKDARTATKEIEGKVPNATSKYPKHTKSESADPSNSRLGDSGASDTNSSLAENNEDDEDDENDEEEEDDEDDADSRNADTTAPKLKRRNDPAAFSNSLARILNAPLTTTQRANPVLARSAAAAATHKEIADFKLEGKARARLRADRREREIREGGRDPDVLGTGADGADGKVAGEVAALEQRLKKTAQRGVIRLFNAVRAAQVRGLEAERAAKAEGMVGLERRRERVEEMSRSGFLEMLVGDGGEKAGEASQGT